LVIGGGEHALRRGSWAYRFEIQRGRKAFNTPWTVTGARTPSIIIGPVTRRTDVIAPASSKACRMPPHARSLPRSTKIDCKSDSPSSLFFPAFFELLVLATTRDHPQAFIDAPFFVIDGGRRAQVSVMGDGRMAMGDGRWSGSWNIIIFSSPSLPKASLL
jgi:hypothetical protein